MFNTQSYDVAIVGGGMVGLATAIGLAQANINTIIIDAGSVEAVSGEPKLRVSAINKASQTLLENIGAWQYINQERLGGYDTMEVWTKDGLGSIKFDAKSQNESLLGNIIENDNISNSLIKRAAELEQLTHIENVKVANIALGDREAWLTLENGDNLTAAVVIAADGANSWVRQQSKIPLSFWDYDHHAIVATIKTEVPHQHCARQVFLSSGPLAFLPLNQDNLCSIVWSVSPQKAKTLLAMDDNEFSKSLTAAFDSRLGLCSVESKRLSFPLKMRYARHFARQRLILAGDAAHTIHPLAGQGVNLGFLDSASIIETLSELKLQGKDLGEYQNLRQLERWRKAEAIEMIAAMESIKRLFSGDNIFKKALCDFGLNFVDKFEILKTVFAKQALGQKARLPKLCNTNYSN
ncbi:FAD-dependent oxidoreductase [Parashewanella spongiae]|uniref:FAD-dependent oxidoreductase n=1 Tax=Parashewanella spongiae TaxID=342950 RepID=A0A3A6TBP1_9GAMM|nr:FAD-dependent monooxygenase [Parashewanella spongiae]MCL1079769.1 FAD-dependent oxidoreductase [Parashewanella spongiae]RJY06907.1 FAD-dependent oxidoreductase [Parashewanella spongiae]